MNSLSTTLLSQGLAQATATLQQFAGQANFLTQLRTAVGDGFDGQIGLGVGAQFLAGDFSLVPEIRVLTNGELGTANGAYAGDVDAIFVSSDFLAQHAGDVDAVAEMLLEEIGHKLDRLLNGNVDSPGDEGAIFRLLATGYPLSEEALAGLKTQDDHAMITVDGQAIAIEQQQFIVSNGNNESVFGTNGDDDILVSGGGVYLIDGRAGNDFLLISNFLPTNFSGTSNQNITVVYTNATNGSIIGGRNNGTTFRNIESMSLSTNIGNDNIDLSFLSLGSSVDSGSGDDLVILGAGNDNVRGQEGNDRIYGAAGNDKLLGGDGNDYLNGGAGNDYLDGGAGNDILDSAGGGLDTLEGRTGDDTYIIYNSADIIIEDFDYGTDTVRTEVNYTLSANIENMYLIGSVNGTGNAGDNTIFGYGIGDNVINGGAGNDSLGGGAGTDTLIGGGGSDQFIFGSGRAFNSADLGIDTITDFQVNIDSIVLDPLTFGTALTFASVTTDLAAANSSASIVYNSVNGNLFYNSNSSDTGFGTGGQFAILSTRPTLTGNDVKDVKIQQPTLNDFNGDSKSDILWRNNDGRVALWQMNGPTVTIGSTFATVSTDWKISSAGDFNGDKKADILWRNDNGQVALWTMNGATQTSGTILATVPTDWKIASTADFGGDGKSDILWRNDDGRMAIWQMDGATQLASAVVATVSTDWKIAGTGDFNGDNKSDILWRKNDGQVALWQMDGLNVLSQDYLNPYPTVDNSWKIAGTGDFNGDSKSDILWRNDDGSTNIWLMDGANVLSFGPVPQYPTVDNSWKISGTGDFNGDNKSDILWRNDNGSTNIWEMNGLNVIANNPTNPYPVTDNTWKIAAPIL